MIDILILVSPWGTDSIMLDTSSEI